MPPEQDLLLGPVPTLLPAVGSERHDRGAARWPSGGRAGWRGAGVLLGLTTAILRGLEALGCRPSTVASGKKALAVWGSRSQHRGAQCTPAQGGPHGVRCAASPGLWGACEWERDSECSGI